VCSPASLSRRPCARRTGTFMRSGPLKSGCAKTRFVYVRVRVHVLVLVRRTPLSPTYDAHAFVYVCRIALLSPTSQSATSSRSSQTRIRLASLATTTHRRPRQLPPRLPPPPPLLIGWGRISHLASTLGALLQWGSSRARLSLRCGAHVEEERRMKWEDQRASMHAACLR